MDIRVREMRVTWDPELLVVSVICTYTKIEDITGLVQT